MRILPNASRFQLVSQNPTRTTSSPSSPQFHPSPLTVARRVAVSGAVPYEVEDRLEKHIGWRGEVRQHDLGRRNYITVEHSLRLAIGGSEQRPPALYTGQREADRE